MKILIAICSLFIISSAWALDGFDNSGPSSLDQLHQKLDNDNQQSYYHNQINNGRPNQSQQQQQNNNQFQLQQNSSPIR